MTVAFIGLGMMGAPMAASLSRNGLKPRLFNANPGAITSFLESNDSVVKGLKPGGIVVDMSSSSPLSGGVKRAIEGKLGPGHALKALNSFLAATSMVAVSFVTEVNAKMCILRKTFTAGFMLGLLAKDVKTASELSDHVAMNTPLLSSAKHFGAAVERAFGFRADHTLVYKFVEQQQS